MHGFKTTDYMETDRDRIRRLALRLFRRPTAAQHQALERNVRDLQGRQLRVTWRGRSERATKGCNAFVRNYESTTTIHVYPKAMPGN